MSNKDWSRPRGGPQFVRMIRSIVGLQGDPGVSRRARGGNTQGLWDYAPQEPLMPMGRGVRSKCYVFASPADVLTDAVTATEYVWNETNLNDGTALTAQDVVGGGAGFTTDTGDNDFYFYESGQEIWKLVEFYDLWFEIILQVSDATQSDVFVGLCARLASGNLFDNRVDCVGFKKDDGDTNIDLETDVSGSTATNTNAQGTLADDTDISLGFHYNGSEQRVYFYIDGSYVNNIAMSIVAGVSVTLPTTEMCVSFGMRNGEAAAKDMVVKAINTIWEVPV